LYNLVLKDVKDNQQTWYNGIGTYARPSWKSLHYCKKVLFHKVDLAIAWYVKAHPVGLLDSPAGTGILNEQFWLRTAGYRTIIKTGIAFFSLVRGNNMDASLSSVMSQDFLVEHIKSECFRQ